MTHVPHELAEDFPDMAEKIHALKGSDAHFARLVEEYHDINRQVHRAETNVMPLGEAEEARLRKQRAKLKDAIARTLGGG